MMYRYKDVKTIDTKSYLSTLCDIAQSGELVSTIVCGSSMVPFLSGNRDYVYLCLPEQKLKKGDIVLFVRKNGDFVLHRIKKVTVDGYYMLGDRQTELEGPIEKSQIKLIAVKDKRKDKILTPKHLKWKFYSKIWINLVFLRPIVFAALKALRKRKKTDC